jgi:diadenosine tetraphosphate (Ap4A) HIT family hydrolase
VSIDKKCCFCREIHEKTIDQKIVDNYEVRNRIIFEDEIFVILPTVSPLVKNHLLVLPKGHLNTMKQLSGHEKDILFTLVKKILMPLDCDYFIFEHGAFPGNGNTCGVDHAHLHVLPLQKEISNKAIKRLLEQFLVENTMPFNEILDNNIEAPYLLFANDVEHVYCAVNSEFPSQTIRKILGDILNIANPDWKEYTNPKYFIETIREAQRIAV